ncbi:MAG: AMP-binding protein, partial [bacterium]|nr:AMP-binding protein [bacterium]
MSNTNYDATVDGKFETPFEKALHQTIQSPDKNRGFISDGTITCKYDEFPAVFQKIDAFLEESGVSSHQCSIFRCGNSLPEALLLARMLCRKSSFFLLPRSGGKGQAFLEDLILPEFCQYKLTVDTGKLTDGIDIHDPAAYISVEPNPQYKSNPFEAGSVFLKTSGSTAEPKLVKHTNENLYRNGLNCVERFELVRGDRVMIPVPLYHMYGFGAAFLPAIIAGASVHLLENTNIIKYLEAENQFKPNISFM